MKSKLLFSLFAATLMMACKKDIQSGQPPQCDESATPFKALYTNLANSPEYQDAVYMDLETHAYTFEVVTPVTLCKIGYQSLPDFDSTPYEIEISDNAGNILYFGSHLFPSAATGYESVGSIPLQPGVSYTVKRIQTNWNDNIGNTVGRMVYFSDNTGSASIPFPITEGDLTITASTFYGTGGPTTDFAIPFIDLVFE
jgi:hypothetical protein